MGERIYCTKQEMKQWKESTTQTIQEKDGRIQELENEIGIGKQENTRLAEEYKKQKKQVRRGNSYMKSQQIVKKKYEI